MKQEIFQRIQEAMREHKSGEAVFEAEGQQWTRKWVAKERLILLGGGHIAVPLCKVGALLDFDMVVVDDRPSFANTLRFPEAAQVICNGFAAAIDQLDIGRQDFVCAITRGHKHDGECLRQLLKGEMPGYLGMIGSRRRVTGLMDVLEEEGYEKEKLACICAPIGLSIGAQTTAEIAVAIAAQLVEYRGRIRTEQQGAYLMQTNVDLQLLETLASGAGEQVMALVVDTKGSTPVKAGAVMAVNAIGQTAGTIGGGCGESEIIQIARHMAGTVQKKLVSVDMTNDVAEEEGMVCGGTMQVLLETVEEA